MPDAALDKTYDNVTKFVTNTMDNNAAAMDNNIQVKWFNFKDPDTANTNPIYSKDYLTAMFDRARLNKNVEQVLEDTTKNNTDNSQLGGLGKLAINTTQIDRVASWQRDLSGRFKSRVRALAHRASTAAAEAQDSGPLRTSIIKNMTYVIKANKSSSVDRLIAARTAGDIS